MTKPFKKEYDAGKEAKKDFDNFQKLAQKEVKECVEKKKYRY